MNENIRDAVAATALCHFKSEKIDSIYDYTTNSSKTISVTIKGKTVDGYDSSSTSYFSGDIPSLYHQGHTTYFDFNIKSEDKIEGYDYASSNYFSVTKTKSGVDVYDYETSTTYSYE